MLHGVPGDFVRQASGKTVCIHRAVIPCEIDDVERGQIGQKLVILTVNIIRVGDMIPPDISPCSLLAASIALRACSSVEPPNVSREPSEKAATTHRG